MKKLTRIALFGTLMAFLGPKTLLADQVASTSFKGINNNENSVIISPEYAQDGLNFDVTPGGKSVKKRSGYGVYKALGTGQALHGGYHAFDSTGNDYQLWGSSTSLYGIVSGGTPTQLVSSSTLNSTWDCTDTQGSSYCVDSNRDVYLKTDGTTKTWFTTPLGTMVESTPDRVVVAGVSGSPNTLFVSQSNTFTNFTTGINATDAFQEVIASPGSKLTNIRWGCGKLLWWKDQSFGYFDFDDQYVAQVKTVSDVIGTFDNTSAIDPGGRVWFRGQDGHTWMYDCSILTKQSIDITPNVQASGKRVANSWTQASQSDFQTGLSSPTGAVSMTISPGDVIVSSFQAIENSSTQWNSGTVSNMTVGVSSLSLTINNSGNITNPDFESSFSGNWSGGGGCTQVSSAHGSGGGFCTITPESGSFFSACTTASEPFQIVDLNNNILYSEIPAYTLDCVWHQSTITSVANKGKRVKIQLGGDLITSDSYIFSGSISYWYAENNGPTGFFPSFDNIQNGSSTITSGSFTSQIYDTGFTSSTFQLQSGFTANTSTPSFALFTSTASNGVFSSLLTSTGTNGVGNRFAKYSSTISVTSTDSALTYISSVTILARSTGTYYSAVHNAPNLTGWSTLGVSQALNGGTETFYLRSSTNSFTTLSSTPAWTAQSVGALIGISTGTYFQLRDDFALTAATQTPTLNDFTFNWFEGSASDQAYMLYFDNAIWESVAYGAGQATNNYLFKYDLINDGWTLYNFGAGGMLVQTNTLYFGDTSSTGGNVFNYGSATSDNGTAINAYWKTRDFTGSDPFLQNQLTNIDSFFKKDTGTTLTATYTMNTSTATSYSISLSTSDAIVQSRKLLPSGKLGQVFNIKIGDISTSSNWELFGIRIGYTQLPYRPTTQ